MDPISMLTGGGLAVISVVFGYVLGVLRRVVPSRDTSPKAICSCDHGLGQHDEKQGTCYGQILRRGMRDPEGNWLGDQWVQCTCRHYDGPQPIEQYLATPTLPPRDGG